MPTKRIVLICFNFLMLIQQYDAIKKISDDHGLKSSDEYCRDVNRTLSCMDCHTSVFCFHLPAGIWVWDLQTCIEGQSCFETTGECLNGISPECIVPDPPYAFTCHQLGLFPHAFDCKTYFLCDQTENGHINPHPLELKCKEGFAYDPLSTLCRNRLKDDKCSKIIAEPCHALGFKGPVPGNPGMYYICLWNIIDGLSVLVPDILYCPDNTEFIKGACRDPTPPSGLNEQGKCIETNKFSIAHECRAYNDCVKDEIPRSAVCSPGEKFDGWEHTCVSLDC